MPRKSHEVDKKKFLFAIQKSEERGPLKNRSMLAEHVANIYNVIPDIPRKITPSVVTLRIKQWSIKVKTPKGRRGRKPMSDEQKAKMQEARANSKYTTKAEKFENSQTAQDNLEALEESVPDRFHHLVKQIRQGSRSAGVKLHCLECCGYNYAEVRRCTGISCPLYLFRPGAKGEIEQDLIDETEDRSLVQV